MENNIKIRDVEVKKLESGKFQIQFFSKESTQTVKVCEGICYDLYRLIKKELKLK